MYGTTKKNTERLTLDFSHKNLLDGDTARSAEN